MIAAPPFFIWRRLRCDKMGEMADIGQKIDDLFMRKLWKAGAGPVGRTKSLEIRLVRLIYIIIKGFSEEQLFLRATSLVYTTLLTIVPLLAVSFAVLKAFGVHTRFLIFLYYFLEPLGQSGMDISLKIIEFVENVRIGVLGSLGLSVLVYTVLSTVQKIESALNYIWNIRGTRSFSERFVNYTSVLLIGPVLVFSAIGITASLMSSTVMQKLMAVHLLGMIIYIISRIMPYLLISAAFTFIYISLPNTKVRFRAALAGGISAAVLWQSIGWIFTSFIATSAHYSAIYSGFASLILFLIWLYWNYLTLLIGARVSFYIQHPQLLEAGGGAPLLSERLKEKLALAIMLLVGLHFHHGKPQWQSVSLTRRLGIPAEFVRDVISLLQEKGLLIPTQSEPPAYLPGKDLDVITLDEIIRAVRAAGEGDTAPGTSLSSLAEVETVMSHIEEGITASLEKQTLRDLVLAADKAAD